MLSNSVSVALSQWAAGSQRSCVHDEVDVGTKTDGKPSAMIHTSKFLKVCDKDCY